MKTRFILSAFFGMALSASAFAQSVQIFNAAFGPTSLPSGGFSDTVSLPTFNSNLGTLQAVTLTLDSSFDGSIDFYVPPQAFMPEQYNASTGTNDFVYDSQDNLLTSVLAPGYVSGTTVPGENSAPVSGRASTFAALTPLSSYESAGNGSLTFEVGGDAVGGFEVGPYFGAPELTAYGDLSIAYEYSAIPEPSTYAAVAGITVLGLAVFRRKRQAA